MSSYPGDDQPRRDDDQEHTQPVGWQQPDSPQGWDTGSTPTQSWDAPAGGSQPPASDSPYGQAPPPPSYAAPSPYASPSPYGQPGLPPGIPMARPDHPKATTSLVLGIVGLAGGLATCGLLLLVSPFAWVIGGRTVKEIKASNGHYGGDGSARAGYVTGIVGTVLLALALLFWIVYIGFIVWAFTSAPSSSDYGNV